MLNKANKTIFPWRHHACICTPIDHGQRPITAGVTFTSLYKNDRPLYLFCLFVCFFCSTFDPGDLGENPWNFATNLVFFLFLFLFFNKSLSNSLKWRYDRRSGYCNLSNCNANKFYRIFDTSREFEPKAFALALSNFTIFRLSSISAVLPDFNLLV